MDFEVLLVEFECRLIIFARLKGEPRRDLEHAVSFGPSEYLLMTLGNDLKVEVAVGEALRGHVAL